VDAASGRSHSTQCTSGTCQLPAAFCQPCSQIRHRPTIFVNIIIIAPRRAFIASQDYPSHFSIRELLQALYYTEAYQHVLVLNPPFAPYALRDVDSSHICKLCLHPTLRHGLRLGLASIYHPHSVTFEDFLLTGPSVIDFPCYSELLAVAHCPPLRPCPLHRSPHLA
jgi:hypothetical protein